MVVLYSAVAGRCKENIPPPLLIVISGLFSIDNPLTIQVRWPAVALQLKVAVDPSVALTDVGLLINSGQNYDDIR